MKYTPEEIFTPQGLLSEVEQNPNLDFLMNVFNIPRAFGVSGFGNGWNVGQHSFACALVALFWSKYNKFDARRRDRLVLMAIVHDLHEAVTGDILPMFKSKQVKDSLNKIQTNILNAIGVEEDNELDVDLKLVDLIAFLYEIKQVSPSILHAKKLSLASSIAKKQHEKLFSYAKEKNISKENLQKFLNLLDI